MPEPKPEPRKFVTVMENPPKGWFEELLCKLFPPESDLGMLSEVHLFDIHSRSNRNWWYDKRGNRWPLRDTI